MSLYKKIVQEDLSIVVWKMDETLNDLSNLLGNRKEELLKEAHSLFKAETRMKEWLTVRAILIQELGECATISYRPNGEPFLKDSSIKIGISHTRGYVAMAFHSCQEVGIDIEHFSNRIFRIIPRFMNPMEWGSSFLSELDRNWYALLVWSMKETIYKCLDIQDFDYYHEMLIVPFSLNNQGETIVNYYSLNYCYKQGISYLRDKEFVLTWAVLKAGY